LTIKDISAKAQTSGKPAATPQRKRSTAAARREVLVEVARRHFAERGYYGTPTQAIADEAGISQAYLFRLFPTKQKLFAATVDGCIAKTREAFERGAAGPLPGESALEAMGRSYGELLADDPTVLLGQLHANAAAAREPEIRDAMRRGWAGLYDVVARLSGAPPDEIRPFFAAGMLLNVAAAVGFHDIDEPWAHTLGAKEISC
jgi:AcrR family transcriptional regulator